MKEELWCKLHVINNCFNDGASTHLGLKYKGDWYCITHQQGTGIGDSIKGLLIEKKYMIMNNYSSKDEFLKKVIDSTPNIVKPVKAYIKKEILENYNELIK